MFRITSFPSYLQIMAYICSSQVLYCTASAGLFGGNTLLLKLMMATSPGWDFAQEKRVSLLWAYNIYCSSSAQFRRWRTTTARFQGSWQFHPNPYIFFYFYWLGGWCECPENLGCERGDGLQSYPDRTTVKCYWLAVVWMQQFDELHCVVLELSRKANNEFWKQE